MKMSLRSRSVALLLACACPGSVRAADYVFTATTGGSIPAGGVLVPGSRVIDATVALTTPAGFNFSVYGTTVTGGDTIRVATNGTVALDTATSNEFLNTPLPAVGSFVGTFPATRPTIFAYWDDFFAGPLTGIYTSLTGIAPNRRYTIEWRQNLFNNNQPGAPVNFAVQFRENSSTFDLIYLNSPQASGDSATIGVQNASTGTNFTQFSYNTASVPSGTRLSATLGQPGIATIGTFTPFSTTYGAASAAQTLLVYGFNLALGITATAPAGYEVSADGVTYGPSVTFPPVSTQLQGTLRVRLAAATKPTAVLGNAVTFNTAGSSPFGLSLTGVVTPKPLTVSGAVAQNKTYDRTTAATITGAALVGVISPEVVTVGGGGTLASAGAGVGIPVTAALTLGGADAANYSLVQPTGLTATVAKKPLTVSGAVAQNKTYDRTTAATITGATLLGVIGPDGVTVGGGGAFASAHAGVGLAVTAALTLGGAEAANYSLVQPTGLTATVTKKPLTVSGAVAQNKTYDRTTAAAITGATLVGILSPDGVTVGGGGTFASANAGAGLAVTAALTLGGADAGNYSLVQPTGLTATVTKKPLTVSGAVAQDRNYDGTTAATITGATLVGIISPDVVTVTGGGTFASANPGTGIAVTSALTLGGADAANYSLGQPTGLTATIRQPTITVLGGFVPFSTTYGSASAAQTLLVYGTNLAIGITATAPAGYQVSADGLTYAPSVTFPPLASQQQGTLSVRLAAGTKPTSALGNAVTFSTPASTPFGISLTGAVTPKPLTVSGAVAQDRNYDGTTSATITGATLVGIISPDVVSVSGGGTFASADPGVGLAVTSALTLGGVDAANYSLVQPTGLTATIRVPGIAVAGILAPFSTTYGSASAPQALEVLGVNLGIGITATAPSGYEISADGVTYSASVTFPLSATPPGQGILRVRLRAATKPTAVLGNAVAFTTPAALPVNVALTGAVTPKPLTVSAAVAQDRNYDGTTAATITGATLVGIVSPDVVTVSGGGTFASASPGVGIAVTAALALGGADAANYSLVQPTGLTATIRQPTITVFGSFAPFSAIYGSASAAQTLDVNGTNLGIGITATAPSGYEVSTDGLTYSASVTFPPLSSFQQGTLRVRLAATTKPTAVLGNAVTFSTPASTPFGISLTGAVTPKPLTVSGAVAQDRNYDGTTAATITGATLVGVLAPDIVTVSGGGTFASAHAGVAVAVTGALTLGGADAANYSLVQPSLTATVTPKPLTVSGAVALDKHYDRTTAAVITGATLAGVISPDAVTVGGNFASALPGTGLAVTLTLGGAEAANYSLVQPGGVTATITPKPLTVGGAVAQDRNYDGTTAATITGATLLGIIAPDVVTVSGGGTFASADPGVGLAVTAALTLGGADAANYSLGQPTGLTATIRVPGIAVAGGLAPFSTTYGSASAAQTLTVVGFNLGIGITAMAPSGYEVSANGVSYSGSVTFAPNAAPPQGTLHVRLQAGTKPTTALGNAVAFTTPAASPVEVPLTGAVLPKPLTVSGAVVPDRNYDGTTAATITGATLVGVISPDVVTVSGGGTLANAGPGPVAVTAALTLGGADAANYRLIQPTGLTGFIRFPVFGVAGSLAPFSTTYGSASAAQVLAVFGSNLAIGITAQAPSGYEVSADGLSYGASVTFPPLATEQQGILRVRLSAATKPTAALGNAVNFTTPAGSPLEAPLTGTVMPKPLTVSGAVAQDRNYDGTTLAVITGATLVGIVTPDVVTVSGGGTFASAGPGTIAVTPALTLGGTDAANYRLLQPTGLTATIFLPAINVTGSPAPFSTTYGSASAAQTLSVAGINLAIGITATAPSGYEVSADGLAYSPSVTFPPLASEQQGILYVRLRAATKPTAALGNALSLTTPAATPQNVLLTGAVTPKPLTVSGAVAQDRVYDGTTVAVITGATLVGVIHPDVVTVSGGGTFANAGPGNPIGVTAALTLGGADSANYRLIQPTGLTAFIYLPVFGVTGKLTPFSTTYGSASVAQTLAVSGVNLAFGVTATAPTGYEVSADGLSYRRSVNIPPLANEVQGTLYVRLASDTKPTTTLGAAVVFTAPVSTPRDVPLTGLVTPKPLTVSGAVAQDRIYDATTAAVITGATLVGIVSPDTVTVSGGGTFASAGPGTIAVTPALTLGGTDAANYSLLQPTGLTAFIFFPVFEVTGSFAPFSTTYGSSSLAQTLAVSGSNLAFGITATAPTGYQVSTDGLAYSASVTLPPFATAQQGTLYVRLAAATRPTATLGTTVELSAPAASPIDVPLTGAVAPKALTVFGAVAQDKYFDGTTDATITGATLVGAVGADVVSVAGGGNFASALPGLDLAVTAALTLEGADAIHYTLMQPTGLRADILQLTRIRALTVTPTSAIVEGLGNPGQVYALEYTDDLAGTWIPFQTVMADPNGQFIVFETLQPRPARRFYRVR